MTPDSTIVVETVTDPSLAEAVADVAAITFPLACPPHSTPENIAAHIAQQLSAERFAEYITDPVKQVLVARTRDAAIIGYSLLAHEVPTIDAVHAAVLAAPGGADAIAADTVTEISKMYVLPDHHAAHNQQRPAHVLMAAAIDAAADRGSTYIWLGVHSGNERAKKYYTKMGFTQIGTKSFNMNGAIEHDFVLGRSVQP
ncbi:GNAT family N-acetyltransferase [Gordonia hydrophobica]|uniref:GNAT family N-acetyltransferase n=1 Tax=Gordonia hydrophobica TaxID=40516 RepID=A0ABZ2U3D9_9ACTN|nr:GNAT family N-acetyltransferase [Gordonia hydrophobica]MBM7367771.1 ribosomal protein S18 acetylase RimI-like enzyme [Gordonia hydrophobica]